MSPLPHRNQTDRVPPDLAGIDEFIARRAWNDVTRTLDRYTTEATPASDSFEGALVALYRATVCFYAGEYRPALDQARAALTALHLTSAHSRLGQVLTLMGRAYAALGDLKNARVHVRDALAAYRRADDQSGLCEASNELARIYYIRGEYDNALEFLQEASACARRAGDVARETAILGNWGRTLLLLGDWPGARQRLTGALETSERAGNKLSETRNLLSLSYLEILQGRADEALAYLKRAGDLIAARGFLREKAIYHEYVGHWHLMTNHPVAAREAFRETLAIGKQIAPNSALVSQACRGLAECAWQQHDLAELEHWIEDGLNVALPLGERPEVGFLYRLRGRLLAARGEFEPAREYFDKALEVVEKTGDIFETAVTRRLFGESLIPGDSDAHGQLARDQLAAALKTFDDLEACRHRVETAILLARCERDAGRTDRAMRYLGSATAVAGGDAALERQVSEQIAALERSMVTQSLSALNEFSLFRGESTNGDAGSEDWRRSDLSTALRHLVTRIGADRVLLLEFGGDTDGTPEVVLSQGSDVAYNRRFAQFVGSDFQESVPLDEPHLFLDTRLVPKLGSQFGDNGTARTVVTVPIVLGEGGRGLLYCDRIAGGAGSSAFGQKDVDFAVAFCDVIAWRMTQLRSARLVRDNRRLLSQLQSSCAFPNIITSADSMHELLARVQMVADSDIAVLIQGETGTGKDLLARAIHYSSHRRDARFVSVNCAALPESLMESELFGAKKGAYTGADRDKVGLFEEAHRGTFFLDEIGEMPLSIQAKVLRMLETKEIVRLGDVKPRRVDVRIISATNRDLECDTQRQSFRQDLYFRLAPIAFTVPPLRERPEDIPLLLEHFRSKIAGAEGVRFAPETVRLMSQYGWPGNVRELENEVKKMILLRGNTETIGPDLLAAKFNGAQPPVDDPADLADGPFSLYNHIAEIERRCIQQALAKTKGVKKHAAEFLNMPESTLRLKMKQYGIERA